MKFATLGLIGLLSMSACATLTGDPVRDCLAATNTANAARLASMAATANAANNPQSPNMQKLAQLAAIALSVAETNQVQVCPVP